MSNKIEYNKTESDIITFNLNYKVATTQTDSYEIEQVIQEMEILAKKIIENLNTQTDADTPSSSYFSFVPSISSYFTSTQSEQVEETESSSIYSYVSSFSSYFVSVQTVQTEGLDKIQITQNIQEKMDAARRHFSTCIALQMLPSVSKTSSEPIPLKHSSQNSTPTLLTPIDCKLATGFANQSQNSWINALLSMIVHVPSLREAYTTVAKYYVQRDKKGHAMQNALTAYNDALQSKQTVPEQISQEVRVAFHHFFQGAISNEASQPEDVHKALQLLMNKYEEILAESHGDHSDLYRSLKTTLHFTPIGKPSEANRQKLQNKEYFWLNHDHTVQISYPEYEILLPLPSEENHRLTKLLQNFFLEFVTPSENTDMLLVAKGKVQECECTHQTRKYEQIPNEFILTLDRFNDPSVKNTAPVEGLSRVIQLPENATYSRPIRYELDAFIAHSGEILENGHYRCYKKTNGKWIEVHNENVSFVSREEIDQILRGSGPKGEQCTSYIHHYSRKRT